MKTLRIILLPLSLIYTLVILIRNMFFDIGIFKTRKIDIPVISVGNITVGGTGKTPIVEYLINYLQTKNMKVAVVSRGYKRQSKGLVIVSDGKIVNPDPAVCGDEPLQIARKFPNAIVLVNENKFVASKLAKDKYCADIIILDDGFQHRKLFRNLDIVILKNSNSTYDNLLLPSGNAREPIISLNRADFLLLPDGNFDQNKINKFHDKPYATFKYQAIGLKSVFGNKTINLDLAKYKKCYAFCGTGNPESFYNTLTENELKIQKIKIFRDHHFYTEADLKKIIKESKELGTEYIITTEKDAIKLNKFYEKYKDVEIYYLIIKIKFIENEEKFLNKIDKLIKE